MASENPEYARKTSKDLWKISKDFSVQQKGSSDSKGMPR